MGHNEDAINENTLAAPSATVRAGAAADRRAANVEHALTIGRQMAPDAKEWSFTGEVADAGQQGAHCACGHGIRWVFTIRRERDGATLPIGSVCIESTVPMLIAAGAGHLADALKRALAAHEAALEAAKKAIRDAEANVEVQGLMAEHAALKAWAVACKGRGVYLPRALWELTAGRAKPLRAATTPGRTAAGLRTRLAAYYTAALEDAVAGRKALPPLPRDAKLRKKVAFAIV